ncbi:MAG: hypothetical protein JW720_14515 [Sedimentisphaerales bacterium]|nr:hypothetical protein [Sedimentisphaerales bacterium]
MEYTKLEKWLLPKKWHDDALLEWKQPQEAWRILEEKSRSLKRVLFWTILFFLFCSLACQVVVWLDDGSFPLKHQLFISLFASVGSIAVASLIWWFAPVIMKISDTAITRLVWNDRKTWHFKKLREYRYESLQLNSKIVPVLVLTNIKGKQFRMALSDSIKLDELAGILEKHGILRMESEAEP